MININNDNLNVANIDKKTSVVEKISHVQKNSSTVDHPVQHDEIDPKKLDDAVRDLNEHIQTVQRELNFSVDDDSGRTVIKVMDMATQEVIRQIPNEEALTFARKISEGVELELFSEYT